MNESYHRNDSCKEANGITVWVMSHILISHVTGRTVAKTPMELQYVCPEAAAVVDGYMVCVPFHYCVCVDVLIVCV